MFKANFFRSRALSVVVRAFFLIVASFGVFTHVAHPQSVTEFSNGITAGERPRGITLGPDGNLWFIERSATIGSPRIGRITSSGVITEFTEGISPYRALEDITAGPDGNLWF